jgi:hypothetical protein
MPLTFLQLMERIDRLREEDAGETPGMQAIRTGLNQSEDFWDNFLAVCNTAEHLADLLGIDPEKVSGWRPKIMNTLAKVQKADEQPDETTEKGTKKTVLPTGDDSQLADPAGVDVSQSPSGISGF